MPPRKRMGAQAAVEIEENVPVGVQSAEVLIAEHEERRVRTQDTVASEDGGILTTHTRPGTLVMYKPTERHGYVPKTAAASAIRLLLRQGWREICPDCNNKHIDKNGNESTDPNLCSAREPLAVRVCRVCGKRIYDNLGFAETDDSIEDDDPNVIPDDVYTQTSPEQRTQASLNLHYWLRHPRVAMMMGLPPLPVAMREMVEGVQAVR